MGPAISISTFVPTFGESRGVYALQQAVLEIIQDSEHWDFTAFMLGNDVLHMPRNTDKHVLSLRYDDHYELTLDGKAVRRSGKTGRRPNVIWFGEPRQEAGGASVLQIDDIAVRQTP